MSEAQPPAGSAVAGPMAEPVAAAPSRNRTRAAMLGAAVLLAVTGLLTVSGFLSYERGRREVAADATLLTESVAESTARQIEAADLLLDRARQLAGETNWSDQNDRARTAAELRRIAGLLTIVSRVIVWDEFGRALASSTQEPLSNASAADRSYFQAHRDADRGLYISEPLVGRIDGSNLLALSRRVSKPDGSFGGVVSLAIAPGSLIGRIAVPQSGSGLAVRWQNEESPEAGAAARTDEAVVLRPVGRFPILIRTDISESAVRDQWAARSLPLLSLGFLAVFAAAGGGWLLIRRSLAQDAYRSALAGLTGRLRHVNAELEARVVERTAALSAAVAQRDLLMKEVNHRLKNSLQLACALVQMQGQTVQEPEVRQQLADTVSRLQAIARVHDQLYRTEDVRRVEAGSYLRSLCADLEQSALASQRFWRILVEAQPIDMATDQAVPLGLMVNELVTNALKHAQPTIAAEHGWTVEVSLTQHPDGFVALSVRDHGPGLPPDALQQHRGSLGMKLLNGLTRQLNAKLTVQNAGPGARFVVRFRPVAPA